MENKEQQKDDVARELLHNKSKLQSLRTYQGDVADIIKTQNESVASITIKEKVRDEEEAPKAEKQSIGISFLTIVVGLVLLGGSAAAILFVWRVVNRGSAPQIQIETDLIASNGSIAVANLTPASLADELRKASSEMGVTLLNVSDNSGNIVDSVEDLFDLLKISPPSLLLRNLSGEYALGSHTPASRNSTYFLLFKANDFGVAFSGLLEWEPGMYKDLSFFSTQLLATSTSETTFVWKDRIVKNKDVRALIDPSNNSEAILAYTFLDKNTVLITNSLLSISEISSIYSSSAVAR